MKIKSLILFIMISKLQSLHASNNHYVDVIPPQHDMDRDLSKKVQNHIDYSQAGQRIGAGLKIASCSAFTTLWCTSSLTTSSCFGPGCLCVLGTGCSIYARKLQRRAAWIAKNSELTEFDYKSWKTPYYENPAQGCIGSCLEECYMETRGQVDFVAPHYE